MRSQWPLSGRMTEAVKDQMRGELKEQPDRALTELGEQLLGCGVGVSHISQIPEQMGLGREKSRCTRPQRDTEANRKRREKFLATLATIPPEKLKFLDESGVTAKMSTTCCERRVATGIAEATPNVRIEWNVLPETIHYALNS